MPKEEDQSIKGVWHHIGKGALHSEKQHDKLLSLNLWTEMAWITKAEHGRGRGGGRWGRPCVMDWGFLWLTKRACRNICTKDLQRVQTGKITPNSTAP